MDCYARLFSFHSKNTTPELIGPPRPVPDAEAVKPTSPTTAVADKSNASRTGPKEVLTTAQQAQAGEPVTGSRQAKKDRSVIEGSEQWHMATPAQTPAAPPDSSSSLAGALGNSLDRMLLSPPQRAVPLDQRKDIPTSPATNAPTAATTLKPDPDPVDTAPPIDPKVVLAIAKGMSFTVEGGIPLATVKKQMPEIDNGGKCASQLEAPRLVEPKPPTAVTAAAAPVEQPAIPREVRSPSEYQPAPTPSPRYADVRQPNLSSPSEYQPAPTPSPTLKPVDSTTSPLAAPDYPPAPFGQPRRRPTALEISSLPRTTRSLSSRPRRLPLPHRVNQRARHLFPRRVVTRPSWWCRPCRCLMAGRRNRPRRRSRISHTPSR